MTIFNFFKKSNVECPRCLGKGLVDLEDIRRLNKQLKWVPAPCAYCNGAGKVNKELLSKVAVDCAYLTIDLPESEIEKIKEGDRETIEKGRQRDLFVDNLIQFVEHQHLSHDMNVQDIANLYLSTEDEKAAFSVDKKSLVLYIQKIIDLKKQSIP
ncbi:hypothetical protein [Flavobacterium hungaricum]|uniref:Uncharacterized protein n=1 Tax=Flavobacterium hungaricum TaxID=2082725 RepID=A0ABR9TL22_9FLAO|nr:hypothetical protein [Flavobacterium hungaricum]MBE8725712.1 hypothetical protein [Flavobacterium hungaricum]